MLVGSADPLPLMTSTLEDIFPNSSLRREWLALTSPRKGSSRDASCDGSRSDLWERIGL